MVAVCVASFASGIALLEVVTTARHANGDAGFEAVTTYGSSHARRTRQFRGRDDGTDRHVHHQFEVVTTARVVTCISSFEVVTTSRVVTRITSFEVVTTSRVVTCITSLSRDDGAGRHAYHQFEVVTTARVVTHITSLRS